MGTFTKLFKGIGNDLRIDYTSLLGLPFLLFPVTIGLYFLLQKQLQFLTHLVFEGPIDRDIKRLQKAYTTRRNHRYKDMLLL